MVGWSQVAAKGTLIAAHSVFFLGGGVATLAVGVAARLVLDRKSKRKLDVEEARNLELIDRRCETEPVDERSATERESQIIQTNTILLVLSESEANSLGELADDFCGTVVLGTSRLPSLSDKTVYLVGDIAEIDARVALELEAAKRVYIIRELSHSYKGNMGWQVVDVGQVPILVHGVGVYYRRFFDSSFEGFDQIRAEHAFQTLTESTKPGTAFRTGIYLTPVDERDDEVRFRLLRCSSNFSGPTVNFGASDKHIVEALNQETASVFENPAPLNHVLAQIYHNAPASGQQKQTKAKIKAHSDKTKDMPGNGLMAFCTFYNKSELERLKPLASDVFDYGYKKTSGLTKLRFRLKDCVAQRSGCTFTPQFDVTLYPNSVFLMPLSTNRLYTHEIRPAALDPHLLPTRMGYVVRCSATEAVHKNGQTFITMPGGKMVQLESPTSEGIQQLRALYAEENSCDDVVDYSKDGPILFSMNKGDYAQPTVRDTGGEFRSIALNTKENLFEELFASVQFESVGKGRQGTVLVEPDATRGFPIVRTTTKYGAPAQCFQSAHVSLAEQIQKRAMLSVGFNNALIETYTNAYAKMGFHSDQDLDLEDGSFVAIFSCYRHPELANPPRKLVVESKEPGGGTFEIPLTHNSVVVWSLETNRRFRHKIVLDTAVNPPQNQWLGITFRTSKTFVQIREGLAYFENGTPLTLADEDQRREFYALRRRENEGMNFNYPSLTYTISESDMMLPKPAGKL